MQKSLLIAILFIGVTGSVFAITYPVSCNGYTCPTGDYFHTYCDQKWDKDQKKCTDGNSQCCDTWSDETIAGVVDKD
jgi:hypothetical protein